MWPPKWRSANSITPAALSTGNVASTSTLTTTMFHVKMGIRNMVMPGARMVTTVVMMLTAVRMPDRPTRATPTIHRSPPSPGVRTLSDSGV